MKYLLKTTDNSIFAYSEALASRPDMLPFASDELRTLDAPDDSCIDFGQLDETFPQYLHTVSIQDAHALKRIFTPDVLSRVVVQAGGKGFIDKIALAEILSQTEEIVPEYADFAKQQKEEFAAIKKGLPAAAVASAEQALYRAQESFDAAKEAAERIHARVASTDLLDPLLSWIDVKALRKQTAKADSKLGTAERQLATAQQRLVIAEQQLKPVQQAGNDAAEPDFKAPGQKVERVRLGCSERHLRDLFDRFKIDHDTGPLKWARLTKAQYERFTEWMESQAATA